MNWWRVWWILWGISGLTVEIIAIIRKQEGDTFTDQMQALARSLGSDVYLLVIMVLGAVFLWAVTHFISQSS